MILFNCGLFLDTLPLQNHTLIRDNCNKMIKFLVSLEKTTVILQQNQQTESNQKQQRLERVTKVSSN